MKILVVDDERDIEVLFEQRFRREIKTGEIDFAFAYSGEQALDYLNQHVHEAVLILSDINMPGTSGFDLSFEVKRRRPDSRTIFVSGDALELVRVANFASPYDVFLEKPYTLESLNTALERALNFPNSSSSETMTWVSPIKSRSGIH